MRKAAVLLTIASALCMLVTSLASGCGILRSEIGSATPPTNPMPTAASLPTGSPPLKGTSDPEAVTIINAMTRAMTELKGFHFLETHVGTGELDEGDVSRPGRVHMTRQGLGLPMEIYLVNGESYGRSLPDGQWEVFPAPEAEAAAAADDNYPINLQGDAVVLKLLDSDVIDGQEMYHLSYSRIIGKVTRLFGEVWIGTQDNYIHRLVSDMEDVPMGTISTTPDSSAASNANYPLDFHEEITLSKFNEPTEIKPPF